MQIDYNVKTLANLLRQGGYEGKIGKNSKGYKQITKKTIFLSVISMMISSIIDYFLFLLFNNMGETALYIAIPTMASMMVFTLIALCSPLIIVISIISSEFYIDHVKSVIVKKNPDFFDEISNIFLKDKESFLRKATDLSDDIIRIDANIIEGFKITKFKEDKRDPTTQENGLFMDIFEAETSMPPQIRIKEINEYLTDTYK